MNIYLFDKYHISLQQQATQNGHTIYVYVEGCPMLPPEEFAAVEINPEQIRQIPTKSALMALAKKDSSGLLILDHTYTGEFAIAEAHGLRPVGCSEAAAVLETNREFGRLMFSKFATGTKAKTVPQWHLSSRTDLITMLKTKFQTGGCVLKIAPNGPPPAVPGITTVVLHDRSSVEAILSELNRPVNRWFVNHQGGCIIEKLVKGDEVAFSAYFNGYTFVMPYLMNVEQKDAQEDNRTGILTGEVGSTLQSFTVHPSKDKTVSVLFNRLGEYLRGKYRGMVDMNFIYNEGTLWFLKFTVRFGRPTLETQIAMTGDFAKEMKESNGSHRIESHRMRYHQAVATGIGFYHYGYPLLQEVAKGNMDRIRPTNFNMPQSGMLTTHFGVKFVPLFSLYDNKMKKWKGQVQHGCYAVLVVLIISYFSSVILLMRESSILQSKGEIEKSRLCTFPITMIFSIILIG